MYKGKVKSCFCAMALCIGMIPSPGTGAALYPHLQVPTPTLYLVQYLNLVQLQIHEMEAGAGIPPLR